MIKKLSYCKKKSVIINTLHSKEILNPQARQKILQSHTQCNIENSLGKIICKEIPHTRINKSEFYTPTHDTLLQGT